MVPARGSLRAAVSAIGGQAKVEEAGLEVEIGDDFEPVADGGQDGQHGEAALGVMAVLLDVLADQLGEDGVPRGAQRAAIEENLPEGQGLVGDPGAEGGQEGVAIDEVVL